MTTSEQWRKIGELFDALVELDAGERNRRLQALRAQGWARLHFKVDFKWI